MLYKGTQKICPVVTKGTEPTITSLTISPSTTAQTYTAPTGIDGYSPINVNAVTSSIDANISASNIKSGVSILGVNGTVTELAGTTTTITSNGTYTPTGGANGFTSVSVNVAGTTPSGTYTITSNGTYDVTDYATADVSVSGGGGASSGYDFDIDAFNAKVTEMNDLLITRDGEYNSGRMERALQEGFIEKKNSASDLDPYWFYVLQLKYDTKCITFRPRVSSECIAFWCPPECNVYTSDGLGRVTNTSDTTAKRITIEFTGNEDRTVIIGTATQNSYNLTLGLFSVFDEINAPVGGKDLKTDIRACHVYLPYSEKRAASATYGSILNTYGFYDILGYAKVFSYEKPNNNWNKLSSDTIYDLRNFNNSLEDTSVFADIYSSSFFDADLGIFKLPSDYLSNLTSYLSRYMQIYSYGSSNGLFPFLVDFSGYSSSTAIAFGGYTQMTSVASAAAQSITMYIKLPSTCNVNMNIYDGNKSDANSSLQLTYKSWQYLANNAPSVSGKTLKVGYQFYNWAKTLQIPSYKTITDALEAKGWSISQ